MPGDAGIWPHELATARALAKAGYIVEFVRTSNRDREHSADAYVDGELWEFKAPNGSRTYIIEKRLREGVKQSSSIVFDSRRMKSLPDDAIQRELVACLKRINALCRLKFIDRHGRVVDIK